MSLDALLFQQGGRCFYCGQLINAYFGNLSPKQKLTVGLV